MELSIIIVNWNTRKLLLDCLGSIYSSSPKVDFEVVVVDNASSDGSADAVGQDYPQARLISNEENVGFARANNQAIALCQGKYVFLLNSDTVVPEGSLHALLDCAQSNPSAGIIGCKILNRDDTIDYHGARSFPTIGGEFFNITKLNKVFPKNRLVGHYPMSYWAHDDNREVDCVLGAAMLLTREMLDKIGALDETFFMYGEDVEICYRAKKNGYKVYYCADSAIYHLGGEATKQAKPSMRKEGIRSMYIYFSRVYSKAYAIMYLSMVPLAVLLGKLLGPMISTARER